MISISISISFFACWLSRRRCCRCLAYSRPHPSRPRPGWHCSLLASLPSLYRLILGWLVTVAAPVSSISRGSVAARRRGRARRCVDTSLHGIAAIGRALSVPCCSIDADHPHECLCAGTVSCYDLAHRSRACPLITASWSCSRRSSLSAGGDSGTANVMSLHQRVAVAVAAARTVAMR